MHFELTNDQRVYFGLEPIQSNWDRLVLKGDTYRPESILYFDGDVIKRHIVSTERQYKESRYDDATKGRTILLPVTDKGKEKKLTASVLEARQPKGVYCLIETTGRLLIGNYNTQTTFYDTFWEQQGTSELKSINILVENFIKTSAENHLSEIAAFKKSKKRNIGFKPGDFFAFKINRTEYGFGRILLNIDELKKANLIPKHHGLSIIMTKPILVKLYSFVSSTKHINIDVLEKIPALPSDYMMDNLLFYGEYEIIGHRNLTENDFDFPMSYGRHISALRYSIFLQWGLIHLEKSATSFDKYLTAENPFVAKENASRKKMNPYGYYSIGFRPMYNGVDIKETIENNGVYDFQKRPTFKNAFDLRNPQNNEIRIEIMEAFGLDPFKSYDDNCELTNTINTKKLLTLISR